jgi:16S rRNA G527 N7-methylase RsmG
VKLRVKLRVKFRRALRFRFPLNLSFADTPSAIHQRPKDDMQPVPGPPRHAIRFRDAGAGRGFPAAPIVLKNHDHFR